MLDLFINNNNKGKDANTNKDCLETKRFQPLLKEELVRVLHVPHEFHLPLYINK